MTPVVPATRNHVDLWVTGALQFRKSLVHKTNMKGTNKAVRTEFHTAAPASPRRILACDQGFGERHKRHGRQGGVMADRNRAK